MSSNSRIKGTRVNIECNKILEFFNNRAENYSEDKPYTVTMLHDNNPEFVEQRNKLEVEKLKSKLELKTTSKILDIACGVRRWSDAIEEDIENYTGIDFSANLIEIANKRNENKLNRDFLVGQADKISEVLPPYKKYNIIFIMGICMYLNEEALNICFNEVLNYVEDNTTILIREPLGIDNRLTLNNFYSNELNTDYNAIYRTSEELKEFFKIFEKAGFSLIEEGNLFDESLNDRQETVQRYFVLKR